MAVSEMYKDGLEPGEALFNKTARKFSLWGSVKSGVMSGFLFGYHGRLTHRRVEILGKPKIARQLKSDLAELTDAQSAHFHGLAAVNKEQAEAAFRYTAIINFTAPITLIVVLNQVFPNFFPWLFNVYLAVGPVRLGIVIGVFLLATVGPVFQAYVSVGIARDLFHLAVIDGARRGNRASVGTEEVGDDQIDPGDL